MFQLPFLVISKGVIGWAQLGVWSITIFHRIHLYWKQNATFWHVSKRLFLSICSSKNNVKGNVKWEKLKRIVKKAESLMTLFQLYAQEKCLTKTFLNWNGIANALPTRWLTAAERDQSQNLISNLPWILYFRKLISGPLKWLERFITLPCNPNSGNFFLHLWVNVWMCVYVNVCVYILKNVYRCLSVVWRPLRMVKKIYVNVCAPKPFVYAFTLSVAHFLSPNAMTVQKHNTISWKRWQRHSLDSKTKQEKKKKKPCKILYCFQAWYPLKLFSLMELELEKYRFKMVFDSWHCDVDASVIGPASDFWHRCEDTVCKCLLRTSCTQFELCRMSVRIFCIFKSWTSVFPLISSSYLCQVLLIISSDFWKKNTI